MAADVRFSVPGQDGELPPGVNIWRKGMVYTTRSAGAIGVGQGYRVSAGIKCGSGAWSAEAGYSGLYHRVKRLATGAIVKKNCEESGEPPVSVVCGHMWGRLGDGDGIGVALVVTEVQCSSPDQASPTEGELLRPGGASLEEVRLLSPQLAQEIYNEFDFAEPGDEGSITLSYGEPVSGLAFDFEPVVARAEQFAASYQTFLRSVGEVRSDTFRITHREWFFASKDFATVHICFER